MFDTAPGEVAVGVVADSLHRSRIQVDVGVLAPDEPGRQCRVLSQETTEVQGHEFPCYLEWVHPVRELLAVKGYACGADDTHLLRRAALDSELADWVAGAQLIQLVGPEELHG